MRFPFPNLFFLILLVFYACNSDTLIEAEHHEEGEMRPSDYHFMQRAYPYSSIPQKAYFDAAKQALAKKTELQSKGSNTWEMVGPINVGGRVTDIEMPASDLQTIYVAAASGGIFKSVDQGQNWSAIFDDALSLSIGDMAIAPSNSSVLYVGTGESNAGGGSLAYDGVGVYKSKDAGASWTHIGLENVGSIGKVVVHPKDEDLAFVAGMGYLFENNNERGVFRTRDGGNNWEQILSRSDSTGGIDLAIHPVNGDTIYAALWQRVRRPNRRNYGGSSSGIYRSFDGGDNWVKLINGLPTEDIGRIGLSIAPSDPNIIHASIADDIGNQLGFYRSENNGDSWTDIGKDGFFDVPYMWWFGRIWTHPSNSEKVYATSLDMFEYNSNTAEWEQLTPNTVHVDQHALLVHPLNNNFIIIGNDGGVYISTDAGVQWSHIENLPINQFYTCELDFNNPEHYYGGTQDNGTIRTLGNGVGAWNRINGGDGFVVKVDPTDNNYIYAESQYGNLRRSTNGGRSFSNGRNGIPGQRFNWNSPFVLDPNNVKRLYFGGQFLYRSDDRAISWEQISPDLTKGPGVNLTYGSLSTIDVSPIDSNILYVGTDDGNVWRSLNYGTSWSLINSGLPKRWISKVLADPEDANLVYVTLSGYRYNDYLPHVFQSSDQGNTWEDISGDLIESPVNDLIVFNENGIKRLIVATDFGVFESANDGQNWYITGTNLPNVPVNDISIHSPTRTLLAGTYGRSMWKVQLDEVTSNSTLTNSSSLLEVYPNPVNFDSRIKFELKSQERVQLSLFDLQGRKVEMLYEGLLEKGVHELSIRTKNSLQAGTYVIRLNKNSGMQSIKLIKL